MLEAVTQISRTVLRDGLAHSEARPLEPAVRAFMEGKFGTDFGDVQIHTGPTAEGLCRALQARAFTLGSDIVFGKGQYAPGTLAGKRLLAHELVHVLQQRPARVRSQSGFFAVGDPQNDCESEADRLAEEGLDTGLRSAVMPDAAGAIRRKITILEDSADMTTSHEGAKPGVRFVRHDGLGWALWHLTRNVGATHVRTRADVSAIHITGSVNVVYDPDVDKIDNSSSSDWRFSFIQFFLSLSNEASYAGPTPSDGSISVDFANFSAYAGYQKYILDADPDVKPFVPYIDMDPPQIAIVSPGLARVTIAMDDHPFEELPLDYENFAAGNRLNYLVSAKRAYDIVTVFLYRNVKTNEHKPLAWLNWGCIGDATFHWTLDRSGTPIATPRVDMGAHYFYANDATKDALTGGVIRSPQSIRDIQDMFANPPTDPNQTYNSASKKAYVTVVRTRINSTNVEATNRYKPGTFESNFL